MIVAVTMRVTEASGYYEPRDALAHDWIPFLESRGLTPVLVPNRLKNPAAYVRRFGIDALLLTGGNDLTDTSIDNENSSSDSRFRDATELNLLQMAIRDRLPVFGVCRGMQLVNSFFGGELCRDLSQNGDHVAVDHTVAIDATVLERLRGFTTAVTNSYHNQGVLEDDLGQGLEVFARAEQGVVEGFVHQSLPITCIQWHPERTNPATELDNVLIEHWVTTCA